jgi:hypothetical protein
VCGCCSRVPFVWSHDRECNAHKGGGGENAALVTRDVERSCPRVSTGLSTNQLCQSLKYRLHSICIVTKSIHTGALRRLQPYLLARVDIALLSPASIETSYQTLSPTSSCEDAFRDNATLPVSYQSPTASIPTIHPFFLVTGSDRRKGNTTPGWISWRISWEDSCCRW